MTHIPQSTRRCLAKKFFLGFDEGNWGAMSRVFNVIERNVVDELKKDDFNEAKAILDSSSMTPEDRAVKLLGK